MLRNAHEPYLIGIRGVALTYGPERGRVLSVIDAPRRRHSQKPDDQYAMAQRLVPDGPYCELFARTRQPGWDAWGNEVADSASSASSASEVA